MYSTGSATDVNDLLNKLVTFCEANGWTRDSLATESTGRRWHAHRGSVYTNFRSFAGEAVGTSIIGGSASTLSSSIAFNLGTGYSGASAWYNQAGTPQDASGLYATCGAHLLTGSITAYHFFAHNSGDSIVVVIEYTGGLYQRFAFGTLDKLGAYTGGQYMTGTWRGHGTSTTQVSSIAFFRSMTFLTTVIAFVKCDVDGETGWHFTTQSNYSNTVARRRIVELTFAKHMTRVVRVQPNSHNGVNVLDPVIACVDRVAYTGQGGDNGVFSPIGQLPKVFYVGLANLVPGQQITIGSTNYRVFPFYSKASSNIAPIAGTQSGLFGFAVEE